jgi:hypothetical protein
MLMLKIYVKNMAKQIPLTRGYTTIVDDEDFDELSKYKWHCSSYGYAIRIIRIGLKRKTIWMHRLIVGTPDGMDTDHINGNRLDNRRTNLRVCTTTQNVRNATKRENTSSRFKGVYWCKRVSKWMARVSLNSKGIYLGYFDDEIDAAKAYNEAAQKHYGEFAKLNVIP